MNLSLSIDELLGYTDGERAKWERWFRGQPPAVAASPVQRGGRFPTAWRLLDHIFLVEKRHTQRLKKEMPLIEETAIAEPDLDALFAFGREARRDLADFIRSASQTDLQRTIEFLYRDETLSFTARKLVFHIFFHEIRHWAQLATAVRNAGFPPPDHHDLLFSDAIA